MMIAQEANSDRALFKKLPLGQHTLLTSFTDCAPHARGGKFNYTLSDH